MALYETTFPWLSLVLFLPLVGALGSALLARWPAACRALSIFASLAELGVVAWLFLVLRAGGDGWLLFEDHAWIPAFGIRYTLGLDGLSLTLAVLTAFLQLVAVLSSLGREKTRVGLFYALLFAMESGILGVFFSLDLALFYFFWEVMLIPMFFLIGVWGHERRRYAAIKFFLFTLIGSLLMLLAIVALVVLHGQDTGQYTFSLLALRGTQLNDGVSHALYFAFLLAFIIKVPLFPLHTWLPDAHTEAPTAGSVILAGLLLKTGVYGLLRIGLPLFPGPAAESLPWLAALGLVGLFYGAALAFAQKDIKRLIACSSVAHMGLLAVGLCSMNAAGLEGAVLQAVNHGITTGALFCMIGMIEARSGSRDFERLGGLWGRAPLLGGFFLFFNLASMGVPGLNNFAGELLILIGAFRAHPLLGALAVGGMVFAAAYTLRLLQGVLWGPPRDEAPMADLSAREALTLLPLAALVLLLGLQPGWLQEVFRQSIRALPLALGGGAP
ncbi:MAG: NADH-quinone oxidoreductase subunit M [Myxococcales bacterium]|nr:NADH-quinone oxidoreductase subunit M [Myxococcales bacterium]